MGIEEVVASALGSVFEGNAKSSVDSFEEDRHLQFRLLDVLSPISGSVRSPQCLRYYCSLIHDATVKHPARLLGEFRPNMWRNGGNEEESTFSPGQISTRGGRYGVALQDRKKVLLSGLGSETPGYIPIDENL